MTHLNRRKALALMGGTVAAAGLSAPAYGQNRTIKVGALRFTSHSASFIAQERKYFADAGLNVEFEFFLRRGIERSLQSTLSVLLLDLQRLLLG